MKEYVIGFCFSPDGEVVALIWKLRPTWMRDQRNGVGGEIEEGETPLRAMIREWDEEVYVEGPQGDPLVWEPMCTFGTEGAWRCHVFRSFSAHVRMFRGRTDEQVEIVRVAMLGAYALVAHAEWVIPFCVQPWVVAGQPIHVEIAREPRQVVRPEVFEGVLPVLQEGERLGLYDCVGANACGRSFVVPVREAELQRVVDAEVRHARMKTGGSGPRAICSCGAGHLVGGCVAILGDFDAARGYAEQGNITLGIGRLEGM